MYFLFELIYTFRRKTCQKPNFASVFKFIIRQFFLILRITPTNDMDRIQMRTNLRQFLFQE